MGILLEVNPPLLSCCSREDTLGANMPSFCLFIIRLWDNTPVVVEKALRPVCRVFNLAVIAIVSREKISWARRPTILEEAPMAGFRYEFPGNWWAGSLNFARKYRPVARLLSRPSSFRLRYICGW